MQRLKLVPDMLVERIEELEKENNRLRLKHQENISKIKNLDKLEGKLVNGLVEDFVKLSDVIDILNADK